jgi:hypothetical protein
MPSYKVAHVHEQGVDLIITPLESSFGHLTNAEQNRQCRELQAHANGAGLAETVVPVWEAGPGRMGFLAPSGFRPFFQSIDMGFVGMNINREISW